MAKTATISFRCEPDFKERIGKFLSDNAPDATIGDIIQWCVYHANQEWLKYLQVVKETEEKEKSLLPK